jgi:hypothetical protein
MRRGVLSVAGARLPRSQPPMSVVRLGGGFQTSCDGADMRCPFASSFLECSTVSTSEKSQRVPS